MWPLGRELKGGTPWCPQLGQEVRAPEKVNQSSYPGLMMELSGRVLAYRAQGTGFNL